MEQVELMFKGIVSCSFCVLRGKEKLCRILFGQRLNERKFPGSDRRWSSEPIKRKIVIHIAILFNFFHLDELELSFGGITHCKWLLIVVSC